MRLLNTVTFQFKLFFDDCLPDYAILSHRWGNQEEEVSFKQFRKNPLPPDLPGLIKIQNFCRLAAKRGFPWAWIDTCCIDKRSSAELSQAINSMYKWYELSRECYVYLADVEFSVSELSLKHQSEEAFWYTPGGWSALRDRFSQSSWFKRGWTLQELIAPRKVVFYDTYWNEIGPLEQLYRDVAQVTRTGENWLAPGGIRSHRASIATRMSWASRRETSEEEDLAYCLLGLFDVNMPLIYGEGARKAFYRLQTEIMKISDDESLFAWTSDQGGSGLLAAQPSYFADSGDIVEETLSGGTSRPPFSMTNKGLEIALPKKHLQLSSQGGRTIRFFLRCSRGSTPNAQMDGKALYVELDLLMGPKSAIRTNCATLKEISTPPDKSEYLISQLNKDLSDNERIYVFSPESTPSGYWGTLL